MNFKFNWLKGIVSIVGGAVLGMIVKVLIESRLNYCPPGGNCLLIRYTAGPAYLFIIGGILLVYIVWSLIEKK